MSKTSMPPAGSPDRSRQRLFLPACGVDKYRIPVGRIGDVKVEEIEGVVRFPERQKHRAVFTDEGVRL